jgi:peptide deformylase
MGAQVLTHPDERLRIVSDKFPIVRKLRNTKTLTKVRALVDAMYEEGGIGMAAPQIGWHSRVVTIRIPMFDDALIIFNPEIIAASDETAEGIEGCLSVPGKRGFVTRPVMVTVKGHVVTSKALNDGKPELLYRVMELDADPGRCIQHEVDHLDGVLFIDRATKVWDFHG